MTIAVAMFFLQRNTMKGYSLTRDLFPLTCGKTVKSWYEAADIMDCILWSATRWEIREKLFEQWLRLKECATKLKHCKESVAALLTGSPNSVILFDVTQITLTDNFLFFAGIFSHTSATLLHALLFP